MATDERVLLSGGQKPSVPEDPRGEVGFWCDLFELNGAKVDSPAPSTCSESAGDYAYAGVAGGRADSGTPSASDPDEGDSAASRAEEEVTRLKLLISFADERSYSSQRTKRFIYEISPRGLNTYRFRVIVPTNGVESRFQLRYCSPCSFYI